MEEKIIERNISEIPKKESNAFDPNKYHNKSVKIAKVQEVEVTDFYPNGSYDDKSTATTHKIKIETEPLHELDEGGNFTDKILTFKDEVKNVEVPITRRHYFGLSIDENGNWFISKHPNAKLWAFMKLHKVEDPTALIGKYAKLVAIPSTNPEDDSTKLRILV